MSPPDGVPSVIAVAICRLHAIILFLRRVIQRQNPAEACHASGVGGTNVSLAAPQARFPSLISRYKAFTCEHYGLHRIVTLAGKVLYRNLKVSTKPSATTSAEKRRWTNRPSGWEQVFLLNHSSYTEARALERKIAARGARRFLEDLK